MYLSCRFTASQELKVLVQPFFQQRLSLQEKFFFLILSRLLFCPLCAISKRLQNTKQNYAQHYYIYIFKNTFIGDVTSCFLFARAFRQNHFLLLHFRSGPVRSGFFCW